MKNRISLSVGWLFPRPPGRHRRCPDGTSRALGRHDRCSASRALLPGALFVFGQTSAPGSGSAWEHLSCLPQWPREVRLATAMAARRRGNNQPTDSEIRFFHDSISVSVPTALSRSRLGSASRGANVEGSGAYMIAWGGAGSSGCPRCAAAPGSCRPPGSPAHRTQQHVRRFEAFRQLDVPKLAGGQRQAGERLARNQS